MSDLLPSRGASCRGLVGKCSGSDLSYSDLISQNVLPCAGLENRSWLNNVAVWSSHSLKASLSNLQSMSLAITKIPPSHRIV
jgi:hypothetical protein